MVERGIEVISYTFCYVAALGGLKEDECVHGYLLIWVLVVAIVLMYAKCGRMEDANSVFSSIAVKDINYWNTMIQGYLKNCFPNKSLKMFAAMLKQLNPDNRTMACILHACASL
ncbi:hypothetical protein V6N12_062723 [Hibiscus sabdariffa]|uniref:Pentatricopeptide repeat-containing protein n=1 Tax=Hibiscus sabdariffa TaxID=183260 RepID=A0ABR2F9P9_9ROSI